MATKPPPAGHRGPGEHESLEISRFYRDSYVEVLTLLTLARLYFHRGDPDARSTVEMSLSLSREYNMSFHLAQALQLLGEMELAQGQYADAVPRDAFIEAHALFIRLGNLTQAGEAEQLASAIELRPPDSL